VIAVAAGALAFVNYRRATSWRDSLHTSQGQAADLSLQLDRAQSELKLTSLALGASNKDRDALQTRIDALAGEKASAEDQRQLATQERDSAVSVLNLATAAAIDARTCLDDVSAALTALDGHGATAITRGLIARADTTCAASDASYANFAAGVR